MNVLMISDVYFPRVNGVSTSIQTYRKDLARRGCRSTLIAPQYDDEWQDDDQTRRVRARVVPFDPEDRLMKVGELRRTLDSLQHEFDLIHIQTPFIAHRVGVRLARRKRIPVVETYHTFFEEYLYNYIPFLPRELLRYLARSFSRKQCNAVDAIVSPSSAMTEALLGYGVRRPIHTIPTGLSVECFERGDGDRFRRKHGIPAERPMVLHVGRVAIEKNIDFIFDVLPVVRAKIPDVLLVIAGEGPALIDLQRRAVRDGIDDSVLFVGYLDRSDALVDCYKAANVFAFASATETQGLVLLEAMASGLPVVSTAEFGTRDILDHATGAIVAPKSVDAFGDSLLKVLNSPALRRELSWEAKRHAATWSSGAIVDRMVHLYQSLANAAVEGTLARSFEA